MKIEVNLLDISGVKDIIPADAMKEISDIANTKVILETDIFDEMDELKKTDLIRDAEVLMKIFGIALVNALEYKQITGDEVYMTALLKKMVVSSRSSQQGIINVETANKI